METGQDKVKKICDVLKKETLDPARQQAEEIVTSARNEAEKIIRQAQEKAAHRIHEAEERLKKQEEVFHSSLHLAFKQAVAKLKVDIQTKVFQPALIQKISETMQKTEVLTDLLKSVFQAIAKSGLEGDCTIELAKAISQEEVSLMMARLGLEKIEKQVQIQGDFQAGIKVKLEKHNIVFDLTDEAIEQLILEFSSENLKKILFQSN